MPSSACDWSSDVCSSDRSEEHTSELQSRSDLVCRLLLEKKKNKATKPPRYGQRSKQTPHRVHPPTVSHLSCGTASAAEPLVTSTAVLSRLYTYYSCKTAA